MNGIVFYILMMCAVVATSRTQTNGTLVQEEAIEKTGGPFTDASIILLLDDSEFLETKRTMQDFRPLEKSLACALKQKAAPIIVSYSLLNSVLSNKEIFFKQAKDFFSAQDLSSWIYKKISNTFYLLIPMAYNKIPELTTYVPRHLASNVPLTQLETVLGLKVDHLETVDIQSLQKKYYVQPLHTSLADEFIAHVPTIFVVNHDYAQMKSFSSKPRWALYLMGHGELVAQQLKENKEALQSLNVQPFTSQKTIALHAHLVHLSELFETIDLQYKRYKETSEAQKKTIAADELFISMRSIMTLLREIAQDMGSDMQDTVQDVSASLERAISKKNAGSLIAIKETCNIIATTMTAIIRTHTQINMLETLQSRGIYSILCGLPTDQFQTWLDFLDTKIGAKFLFFKTCYGGGKGLDLLYQNQKDTVQKTYRCTIASAAVAEVKAVAEIYMNQFTQFFETLRTDDTIDFVQTLNYASGFLSDEDFQIKYRQNLPLLKLPGLTWVSVLDIPNKIVSIGKTLARSRSPQQPLQISTFFAGRTEKRGGPASKVIYPDALLLYADIIPFELVFSRKLPPTSLEIPPMMISMISGDAVHECARIDASQFGLFEMAHAYLQVAPHKIFLFQELVVKNDIINWPTEQNASLLTLSRVIFFNNILDPVAKLSRPTYGFYFTHDNKYYCAWSYDGYPTGEEYTLTNFTELSGDYLQAWLTKAATIKSENTPQSNSIFSQNLDQLKKFMEERIKK